MDKDDPPKDSVESSAVPNDINRDEEADDNQDNDKDSSDFSTSSFASCNEENVGSDSSSPPNVDDNDEGDAEEIAHAVDQG